ncbi:hypothetical protein PtA15_9A12 [Puccinia triticina]|uniref:Thiolase C-terminal domain-containing protein n=1 Tax=Puccinia triticina TaxID=208348 RepID=A0ABY7CSI4_9BASI|nr:uncharacterized protein PtA15_9A12 [Puccinia triticina]WAQ87888.1 hypothetical protein PtA15_9A12 [Puccinia triticina]WAR60075.1 hypothetical protein PtB15_9B12 [Puccinia triticina]
MDHPIPAQLPALAQNRGAYLDAVPGRSRQDERRAQGDDCAESTFVAAVAAGDHQCNPDLAAIPGGRERVCVGVYTPEGLAHLGAVLSGLGVQHHMRCAMEETIWMGVDRIKLLSEYRNQALLAFDNADRALDGLSNLVFINDVFLFAQDILELLWQPPAYAEAACAPIDFPIAPTLAIPMALEKAGLEFKDMTKIEINEAFPVVALASMKILGIKAEKVNVNGGAVALGHPIGSSCCWIVVSLINSLKPGEYGVAGVCNGGGAASAMVIQRL